MPTVNVNGFNPPVAVNVHAVGDVIMLADEGLVRPKLGEVKHPLRVPTSAGAKPLPDTVTTAPTCPEVGLSESTGAALVTVRVAWATSPVGSPLT